MMHYQQLFMSTSETIKIEVDSIFTGGALRLLVEDRDHREAEEFSFVFSDVTREQILDALEKTVKKLRETKGKVLLDIQSK